MKRPRFNVQSADMSSRPELRLEWCSHSAARYAVEHWHYSGRMPKSKLAKIGVWESGVFVGAVIYGVGAGNSTNGKRFGLAERFEMAELVRVALTPRETPTSKVVSISLKMIRKEFPKLRLITSFADEGEGHIGTIYQASGWAYLGRKVESNAYYIINGKREFPRTLHLRYGIGGQSIPWIRKHLDPQGCRVAAARYHYVYPLDAGITRIIEPLTKPYPKRPKDSSEPPAIHAGEGGAAPTRTLQNVFPLRDRMSRLDTG